MRINKYLSECGYCSRREADRLIEERRITIDGIPAEMGADVGDGNIVRVDGKKIERSSFTYLAFCKPRGIVCTFQKKEKMNLAEFLDLDVYVSYAGRLDKDSEGLLLLTNDGSLSNALMTAGRGHEKEYVVKVRGRLDETVINKLEEGVYLEEIDRTTRPCKAWISAPDEFHIILTEGINRQIRRMCKAVSLHVEELKRIRIENIMLGGLEPGKYRNLTSDELAELKRIVSSGA